MKFVPVAVNVIAGLPAVALFGLSDVSVGAGLIAAIVKVTPPDTPPPGDGVITVTVAVPAVARSVAGTCAVSVVEPVTLVGRAVPFHISTDDELKSNPIAVMVIAELPTATIFGLISFSNGLRLPVVFFDCELVVAQPERKNVSEISNRHVAARPTCGVRMSLLAGRVIYD